MWLTKQKLSYVCEQLLCQYQLYTYANNYLPSECAVLESLTQEIEENLSLGSSLFIFIHNLLYKVYSLSDFSCFTTF